VPTLLPIIASVLASVVGALRLLGVGRTTPRDRVRSDLELAALLPEDSPMRARLIDRGEVALSQVLDDEAEKSRDTTGVILALLFVGGAGATGYYLAPTNGLWWVLVVVLGLFGVVGLNQDAVPRRRDGRGRPIKGDADEADGFAQEAKPVTPMQAPTRAATSAKAAASGRKRRSGKRRR